MDFVLLLLFSGILKLFSLPFIMKRSLGSKKECLYYSLIDVTSVVCLFFRIYSIYFLRSFYWSLNWLIQVAVKNFVLYTS